MSISKLKQKSFFDASELRLAHTHTTQHTKEHMNVLCRSLGTFFFCVGSLYGTDEKKRKNPVSGESGALFFIPTNMCVSLALRAFPRNEYFVVKGRICCVRLGNLRCVLMKKKMLIALKNKCVLFVYEAK